MHTTRTTGHTLSRRYLAMPALLSALAMTACDRAEPDLLKIPELAAVEVEPGAVEIEPGEIELKLAEVELEEALPLGQDDAGKVIMASGFVIGKPVPGGFFLLTRDSHVLFAETTEQVMPGDIVRLVGPLQATVAVTFQGWQTNALGSELQAGWDLQREWYIDADVVEVYRRVSQAPAAVVIPVPSPDSQPSPDTAQRGGQ